MKKLILLTVTLLAFNSSFTQTLKGKITYRATINTEAYLERLNNDTVMPAFRKEHRIKLAKDAVPTNFHLLFKGKESLYKAEHDIPTKRRLGTLMNKTGSVGSHHVIYYTNIGTKEKFYQSFWTQEVLVNMDDIDWKLTQETKKIGKYLCYKATAIIDSEQMYGMNFSSPVVAWYTPQIPVHFGIQTFVGLPGLTLELIADLEDGKIYYYATKIELNLKEEIEIIKPKATRQISQQDYLELIKRLNAKRRSGR